MTLGLLVFAALGFAIWDYLSSDKKPQDDDASTLAWMIPLSFLLQIWVVQLCAIGIFIIGGGIPELLEYLREKVQWLKKYPERKRIEELVQQKRIEQEANETLKLIGVTTFTDNNLTEALDALEAEAEHP